MWGDRMWIDEAQLLPEITLEVGETVKVKMLSGKAVTYEVTRVIEPGRWGIDPYIPSNIIRGEN